MRQSRYKMYTHQKLLSSTPHQFSCTPPNHHTTEERENSQHTTSPNEGEGVLPTEMTVKTKTSSVLRGWVGVSPTITPLLSKITTNILEVVLYITLKKNPLIDIPKKSLSECNVSQTLINVFQSLINLYPYPWIQSKLPFIKSSNRTSKGLSKRLSF